MGFVNKSLTNIPIEYLIATPLNAAGKAQEMLARVTINFIKSIGFQAKEDGDGLEAITVEFSYTDVEESPGDEPIATQATVAATVEEDTSDTITINGSTEGLSVGQNIYNSSGLLIGEIDSIVADTSITLSSNNKVKVSEDGKLYSDASGDGNAQDIVQTAREITYSVPLLAIVWVPSLFIQTVDIDFEAKVDQVSVTKSKVSASAKFKAWYSPYSFKASGSVTNTSKKSYSATYRVQVHAEDKGYPEGLEKIIDALTSAVGDRPSE